MIATLNEKIYHKDTENSEDAEKKSCCWKQRRYASRQSRQNGYMKNPLIINRIKPKDGGQKFQHKSTAEELDIKNINVIGLIIIDVDLFKNGDTIVVTGAVNFRVKLVCVNCLENYEKDFSGKVYQEYVRGVKPIPPTSGHLEDVDFTREYYTGDFLDLTTLIRDTVQLTIPLAPWCREDCSGVCP